MPINSLTTCLSFADTFSKPLYCHIWEKEAYQDVFHVHTICMRQVRGSLMERPFPSHFIHSSEFIGSKHYVGHVVAITEVSYL